MKTLFFKTCPLFSSMLITICIYMSQTNYKYRQRLIVFMVLFLLVCVYTHRIPEVVHMNSNKKLITSPAYGKIVEISRINNHVRICIFLNLDDVHVQYIPTDGVIANKIYKPGEFNPANLIEKGESNERMETYITPKYNPNSTILINQIAGILARAIINFKDEGDIVKKGDMMGIIQFGSRVDIYIPRSDIKEILVRNGERVNGPETALVKIK